MILQLPLPLRRKGRALAKPRKPTETADQTALAALFYRSGAPARGWQLNHPPLEGKRSPATWRLLQAKGTRKGWPDFDLISPEGIWHGMELKRPGETLTPEQQEFAAECDRLGRRYRAVWGFDQAVICWKEWGVLR